MSSLEQAFKEHVSYTQRRFREMDDFVKELRAAQTENARQISELTAAVQSLTTQTSGVVDAYNNMRGAVKVGVALQDFVVWLGKWGFFGAAMAALIKYVLDHVPPAN